MIHFYNGDGKGKTSSATGAAIRMAGHSKKVLFSQFLKGNATGEINILVGIKNIDIIRNSKNYGFVSTMSESSKEELRAEHNSNLFKIFEAVKEGRYDLVVMDEIGDAVLLDVADIAAVEKIIKEAKSNDTELIMTGHKDVGFIMDSCDYHTRFVKVKHPFDNGVGAREGIEY